MNNKNIKENENEDLRFMCDIFGISPKDLKTEIDVYSQDISGRKIIIDKKLYSAEDLLEGNERASSQFYDVIINAIIRYCRVSGRDILGFAYPDNSMNPRKLVISITNYVEQKKK